MTEAFALCYIPRRMKQLGYGDDYFLGFRHFVLPPDGVLKLEAGNDIFIQLSPFANFFNDDLKIKVESEFGFFDQAAGAANEMVYEHRGQITITNLDGIERGNIQFIQVIPKNK